MLPFVLDLLRGKVVERVAHELRHNPSRSRSYDCYRVVFTDGTAVLFTGNSSADVECELVAMADPVPTPETPTRNLEI